MVRPDEAVEALLQEFADLLAITDGDPYKIRAYENAARTIAGYPADVSHLDVESLREIPNIGRSIAEKITEYFTTGRIEALERLREEIPAGVRELVKIPTLGPRRAMVLYTDLGIASVAQLEDAIQSGLLEEQHGFGPKTAANLLHGIELLTQSKGRIPLRDALATAEEIIVHLSAVPACMTCTYAGSLRRMCETVGDVDVLAASTEPEPVMDAFTRLPIVAEVIARGPTKTSVRTATSLQVDLRVVPPASWGAALQYFTGSKEHNIRVREIAVRKGLKLSEYGLFRVDDDSLVVSETEEEVYAKLELAWIPPTLREDRGEIEAARTGRLPRLVTVADIQGDLHTHTDLTDGAATLSEMLAAAQGRGYHYYAVTDHAKNLTMQRMTDEKMLDQRSRLRMLADTTDMELLHGTELNIEPDGEVDWDADFLAGFDLRVASIHSRFGQPRKAMTRRLVRACENPHVNIIGHPTTRRINQRPPVNADFDAVFEAAAATGTALEVNSSPDRLDLPDDLILRARHHGVKFAVNTDAHAVAQLDFLRYGVGTAQRGWLTPDDVINTWPLEKLREFVAAKQERLTPAGVPHRRAPRRT
ncbi:DNA polymerase/3'-5' exonuclease PolX [Planosporangium flavigriseum]|uniref:DNA polymerase beta n=1 Tax=Planosporangium flavigriseum TaxID=373681 RepID=A0A8J3LRX1_9ACTN|nr:DNA polymerase/3'-5' exonuclease PolX [Planosporangium flavigriseum]NJC67610.1 DNA polymerase/3'-5' exonuclease PolX [Planosporangium flavigriseum]GIG75680.1 DNA polymerase/3'-5' exonuclease PolX [Planosporangium flavigriseum]